MATVNVPVRAEAVAPAATCPQVETFFRNGKTNEYVLAMRSNVATSADLALEVIVGSDTLAARVPTTIDKPTAAMLVPFRSTAILLTGASDERQTDIVITFRGSYASCPAEAASYNLHAKQLYADAVSQPTGAYADIRKSLQAESVILAPVELQPMDPTASQCSADDVDAKTPKAIQPVYPAIAKSENLTGSVAIVVDLDDRGALRGAEVFHTSGSAVLDEAARQAAIASTYTPEVIACTPTGGLYLFRATFASQ